MGRKQLYEAIQALEARIRYQESLLNSYDTVECDNKINPYIANNLSYEKVLGVCDKIQAVNRYKFVIPELNLPSNKVEALYYDFGSLAFSRIEGELKVTSFAKVGSLNGIGDLTEVIPIDLAGRSYNTKKTVVYDSKIVDNPCVIIQDYTGSWREDGIYPRSAINRVSIKDQAFVYKQLKNSILLTARKAIAFISNEGSRKALERALNNMINNDSPIWSIIGEGLFDKIDFHNIDTRIDIEGYLSAIETYEKIRANFNGIKTRSHLEKKERLITSEAEQDNALTNVYLYDGLINRQIGIALMKMHGLIREGYASINSSVIGDENNGK